MLTILWGVDFLNLIDKFIQCDKIELFPTRQRQPSTLHPKPDNPTLQPLQGYLAHERQSPPYGHHRTLGLVLL